MFGLFGKKIKQPTMYPSGDLTDWMQHKLDWAEHTYPNYAYLLFDPSSGDYLPLLIHAGGDFDQKALQLYRKFKEYHPGLVREAKEKQRTDLSCSRILDMEDLA